MTVDVDEFVKISNPCLSLADNKNSRKVISVQDSLLQAAIVIWLSRAETESGIKSFYVLEMVLYVRVCLNAVNQSVVLQKI